MSGTNSTLGPRHASERGPERVGVAAPQKRRGLDASEHHGHPARFQPAHDLAQVGLNRLRVDPAQQVVAAERDHADVGAPSYGSVDACDPVGGRPADQARRNNPDGRAQTGELGLQPRGQGVPLWQTIAGCDRVPENGDFPEGNGAEGAGAPSRSHAEARRQP